jgi:hypothetical protein
MFTKIDKKILIILIIALVIILMAGFFVYRHLNFNETKVENSTGGAQTEAPVPEQNQVEIQPESIQAEGNGGEPMLSICVDKCGDGTCQKEDPGCGEPGGNLNCICLESLQDCPQDCE